ncbi:unnamed protein product, partial [Urochloa humidicola]
RRMEFALENIGLKEHKWPDIKVDEWPLKEKIQRGIQTDGFSCGLFLITFMEYWTGEELSDDVTQDYMTKFRFKLAVILLLSELNQVKGTPYVDGDDTIGSPSDLAIIDNPNVGKASVSKRKRSVGPENSVDQKGTPQPIQTQTTSTQVPVSQDPDEELWAFQAMK